MRLREKVIVTTEHVYVFPGLSAGPSEPNRVLVAASHAHYFAGEGMVPEVHLGESDAWIMPQLGTCTGWLAMGHTVARLIAGTVQECFPRVLNDGVHYVDRPRTIWGLRVWYAQSDEAALAAIWRDYYRWDRRRLGRVPCVSAPLYERTRRLELLRLIGIRRCGRTGTATRIHSMPPMWDGFGDAPFAWVDVPDDCCQEITACVNDRGQLSRILGGGELHRAAFGSSGSRLTFQRV